MLTRFLTLGLVLTACAKKPADTTAVVVYEEPQPETTEVEVWSTKVYVDPPLAEACGLAEADVHFEVDSSKLDVMDRSTLRAIGLCLKQADMLDENIEIVGHADPRGTSRYNQELGRDRAESVEDYLINWVGLPDERIDTASKGENFASKDPEQWADDRRVDIKLSDRVDVRTEVNTVTVEVDETSDSESK